LLELWPRQVHSLDIRWPCHSATPKRNTCSKPEIPSDQILVSGIEPMELWRIGISTQKKKVGTIISDLCRKRECMRRAISGFDQSTPGKTRCRSTINPYIRYTLTVVLDDQMRFIDFISGPDGYSILGTCLWMLGCTLVPPLGRPIHGVHRLSDILAPAWLVSGLKCSDFRIS
jgi:hypothetical protein